MTSPQRAKAAQTKRSTRPALLLRAVASRRPMSAHAALTTLIGRAKDLCAEGIEPKLSVERCVTVLAPILKFIASESALHGEVALSREMCGAVLRIAEALAPLKAGIERQLTAVPRAG